MWIRVSSLFLSPPLHGGGFSFARMRPGSLCSAWAHLVCAVRMFASASDGKPRGIFLDGEGGNRKRFPPRCCGSPPSWAAAQQGNPPPPPCVLSFVGGHSPAFLLSQGGAPQSARPPPHCGHKAGRALSLRPPSHKRGLPTHPSFTPFVAGGLLWGACRPNRRCGLPTLLKKTQGSAFYSLHLAFFLKVAP